MEIKHGRGYVYSIQYHIVWCTKYRRKILVNKIENRLKEMNLEIAETNNFSIISQEIMPDHIHLLIDCTPQHYIPDIMKALKGNTARFLFKEFPSLKTKLWGGHLWNPSYFVSSISETIREVIENYINTQKER